MIASRDVQRRDAIARAQRGVHGHELLGGGNLGKTDGKQNCKDKGWYCTAHEYLAFICDVPRHRKVPK
jgi:hypothetical protein